MSKINSMPVVLAAASATAKRAPQILCMVLLASMALAGCNSKDYTAFALTTTGAIIEFATNKPSDIINQATVTGLTGSDTLVQLVYPPASTLTTTTAPTLYGVTSGNELCQVDPLAGLVSGCSPAFIADRLSNVAASFDPLDGDVRITANDSNQASGRVNLLIDTTGALISLHSNDNLDYSDSTSGTPQINALAFDNPISGTATSTLYALDVNNQSLDRIGDKNAAQNDSSVDTGDIQTIGPLNVAFTSNIGFAIAPQDGTAYAVLGGAAGLYTIDLGSGAATLVGTVHNADYTLISLVIAASS